MTTVLRCRMLFRDLKLHDRVSRCWPGSDQPSSHTNVALALSLSHRNAVPSIELISAFHFAVLPLFCPTSITSREPADA